MMEVRKTNLFVVGAMKAGTTSFIDLLSQHTDIHVPPVKEPHFFVNEMPTTLYEPNKFFSIDNYFKNEFPKPLHITKIEKEEHYQKLFSQRQDESYQLDASTAYLHAEEAALNIFNYNPNAKIIVLLRAPLKRSFSHYKMDLGKGRTKASFDAIMTEEIASYEKGELNWYSRLAMSFYTKPIARYQKLFKQVMIIHFEDLIKDQESVLKDISNYLEIDAFTDTVVEHKNTARKPMFPKIVYILKRTGLNHYFSSVFSSTFKQWLSIRISTGGSFKMELSEETKSQLDQIYNQESAV